MTDMNDDSRRTEARRVGVWLVGARGSVSTCVAYGHAGLRQGWLETTGLVTARPPFDALELVPVEDLVLAGCDVCRRPLTESAGELERSGVLDSDLVTGASEAAV